jgi:hypothetical protein
MALKIVPGEPGPSEYSWGKGIMQPLATMQTGIPNSENQLRALHRLNKDPVSIDDSAEPDYSPDIRET